MSLLIRESQEQAKAEANDTQSINAARIFSPRSMVSEHLRKAFYPERQ
jgi:hypothetical protein